MTGRDDARFVVGVVSLGHFLSHLYLLAFPPLFPLLREEFALSNAELGLILSGVSVTMLLQTPVGRLVDRAGAKWVFVAGIAVTATGVLLAGFATSFPMLLAFALLSGLGQSTFHPADFALIGAVTPGEDEGKAFGVHMFGGNAGFAVAPAFVGFLGLTYGWQTALLVSGAVGIAFAGVAAVALEPVYLRSIRDRAAAGRPAEGGWGVSGMLTPPVAVMFAYFFFYGAANFGIQGFLTVYFVEGLGLDAALGNTTLTTFFVLVSGGILVGGVLADRYSPRRLVGVATAVGALVVWVAATDLLVGAAAAAVAVFAVVGFAFGIILPSRDRLVSMFAPRGSTGTSFGFVSTGIPLAGLLAPPAIGAVIDLFSPNAAFLAIGAFLAVAAAGVTLIGPRTVGGEAAVGGP